MEFYNEVDHDGVSTDICYSVYILGVHLRASKRVTPPATKIKREQAKKALRKSLCKTRKFIRIHKLSEDAWTAFCDNA